MRKTSRSISAEVIRRFSVLSSAVLVASTLCLFAPGTALASCNPGRANDGNYYWTWVDQAPGYTVNGVYSSIWNYQPYVPSGQFSYSWVMLTAAANWTWAQIGNYEYSGGREVYLQYADGKSPAHGASFGAQPLNTLTPYDVGYGVGTFSFQVNGSLVFTHSASWTPTDGELSSEITSLNTQMMGATQNTVSFNQNQISYNGSWHTLSSSLHNSNSTYFGISGNGSRFLTWDKACAS